MGQVTEVQLVQLVQRFYVKFFIFYFFGTDVLGLWGTTVIEAPAESERGGGASRARPGIVTDCY